MPEISHAPWPPRLTHFYASVARPFLWWCSTLLLTFAVVSCHDVFSAVPVPGTGGQLEQYYLVTPRNIARLIPDAASLELLDPYVMPAVTSLEELQKTHTVGEPLPVIAYKDKSPDDCLRIYFLKSDALNGKDIFLHYRNLGEYMNPSVFHFRGRLLMVVPLQVGPTGSEHRKATGTIEFKWQNDSAYPFYTTEPYLGVANEVARLNIQYFVGEDPRVLYYNESMFQIYFTYGMGWIGKGHQKMGLAEVRYDESEQCIKVAYMASPIMGKAPLDMSGNQKNWSPFLHRGEALLVQSIHPLVVVQLHGYGTDDVVASIKARVDYSLPTKLGSPRGGTNAIALGNNTYLAFYHIRTRLPWAGMNTYLYGAYVFSAEPYAMVKFSPTPIMEPRELYEAKWASRFIDYCIYPMYISRLSHDTLHISFGHQDRFGYIATMNLTRLLDSLVRIRSEGP